MFTSFLTILLVLDAEAPGQRPEFQHAKVEARAVSSLDRDVAAVAAAAGPDDIVWVAWRIAGVPRTDWSCVQRAEGVTDRTAKAPGDLIVMARVAARRVERIRTFSPACPIDTGGTPVVWLDGVTGAASVAWLGALATAPDTPGVAPELRKRLRSSAMDALSLHSDPSALAFLTHVLK